MSYNQNWVSGYKQAYTYNLINMATGWTLNYNVKMGLLKRNLKHKIWQGQMQQEEDLHS